MATASVEERDRYQQMPRMRGDPVQQQHHHHVLLVDEPVKQGAARPGTPEAYLPTDSWAAYQDGQKMMKQAARELPAKRTLVFLAYCTSKWLFDTRRACIRASWALNIEEAAGDDDDDVAFFSSVAVAYVCLQAWNLLATHGWALAVLPEQPSPVTHKVYICQPQNQLQTVSGGFPGKSRAGPCCAC